MKLASQGVLIAAIVAIVAAGAFLLLRDGPSGGMEIVLPSATPAPRVEPVELKVYITGAVRNTGVYVVSDGDRLGQVIEAAGGATEDADLSAVSLAVRVRDEDHWHIPRIGEASPSPAIQKASGSEKLDINAATVDQLTELPGVGKVKAQAIVSYREANGPFVSIDGLLDVPGIGAKTLDGVRDLIEVR